MRLIHWLLILLLGIAAAFTAVALTPEPPNAAGLPHPDIATMRIGGDGLARFEPILIPAVLLHGTVLVFVTSLVLLGIAPKRRTLTLRLCLIGIGVAALAVWSLEIFSYLKFLRTGETAFFLGFPEASAWMLFGTWASGALFMLLYVIGFRHWILPHEDERAFDTFAASLDRERGER